jgi:uncharacterized phiE125 gp8 family phage protein
MSNFSPIKYILITDAITEVVTLAEIKTFLRIDGNDFDNILTPFIKVSRQIGEKITGREFVEKEFKTYLDYFPSSNYCGIELRKSKLKSITSIQYYDENDTLQTLDANDYYFTDSPEYSSIYLKKDKSFPNTYDKKQAVIITFKADYPNRPEAIKQACLSICSYLFENSGDCIIDENNSLFQQLFYPYILGQKLFIV